MVFWRREKQNKKGRESRYLCSKIKRGNQIDVLHFSLIHQILIYLANQKLDLVPMKWQSE